MAHHGLRRLVLALLLAPATASAYSQTRTASGTSDGFNGTMTWSGVPAASSNITVTVTQYGDFGYSTEYSTVYIDGTLLGTVNPTQSSIDCVTETGTFTAASSYAADGTITILVDATSNVGYSICSPNPITYTVTVSYTEVPANTPPTAEANGPYTVNQGVALTMNSSGSADPGGSITLYEWDCTNNGSYDVSNGTGSGLTCTYPDDGTYTARLRVTDNNGTVDQGRSRRLLAAAASGR
jgi:hypothetical protein